MNYNKFYIISGPSGVGKDTIVKEFLKKHKKNYQSLITYTTRKKREKEINDVNYHFVTKEQFLQMANNDEFLEYDEHFGELYGSSKKEVLDLLEKTNIIGVLDVNGALALRNKYQQVVTIIIVPENIEQVKEQLKKRNSETDDEIKTRLERFDYELSKKQFYDFVIVNKTIEESVKELENILK